MKNKTLKYIKLTDYHKKKVGNDLSKVEVLKCKVMSFNIARVYQI